MPIITSAEHIAIHELALQLSEIASYNTNMQILAGSIEELYANNLYENIYNALLLSTCTIMPDQQQLISNQPPISEYGSRNIDNMDNMDSQQSSSNNNTFSDSQYREIQTDTRNLDNMDNRSLDNMDNRSLDNNSYYNMQNDMLYSSDNNSTYGSYNGENRCIECGEDMGECNPRQLCGKIKCMNNI